ncbi:MAG: peptide-methionine (R)-S-oxide reductase MsrB [Phycisphaerales bacterium]
MRIRTLFSLALATAVLAGGCSCEQKQSSAATPMPKQAEHAAASTSPAAEQKGTTMTTQTPPSTNMNTDPMKMTDAEWKAKLSPMQYNVLREKGTERAFTGKYWDTKTPGVYKCAGCGTVLFTSGDKFDSGCGWPSFDKLAAAGVVKETRDSSHGMERIEVTCAKCGGHLGHVFDDGPTDTHLRYCINSASIELEASGDAKDAPKK